jgi:endonuclease/exonuclease/phosphatase family metal-dependent hydrolase
MRNAVLWSILLFAGTFAKEALAQSKENLLVLSYNVRHCSPPAQPARIDVDKIAEIIRKSGADLVGLQEIDVHNERSGATLHQAKKLGELTGMYFYFSKAIDYRGGAYGSAILSKYPLSDTLTLPLPLAAGTEPRTLSLATAVLPSGKKVRIGNTHLDYTSDLNARAQAEKIIESLKHESMPVFLMGDFNVEQDSKTYALLRSQFRVSCEGKCPGTIPADKPTKTIDFIFYRAAPTFTFVRHAVLEEAEASDHRPVLAQFNF